MVIISSVLKGAQQSRKVHSRLQRELLIDEISLFQLFAPNHVVCLRLSTYKLMVRFT